MSKLILSEINLPAQETLKILASAMKATFNEICLEDRGLNTTEEARVWNQIERFELRINDYPDVSDEKYTQAWTDSMRSNFDYLLRSLDGSLFAPIGDPEVTVPTLYCMYTSLRFQCMVFQAMYGDGNFEDPALFCSELIATWRFLPAMTYLVNDFQPEIEIPLVGTDTGNGGAGSH